MSGLFFRIVARLWTSGKLYIEMRIYFRTRSLCVCVWRGENQSLASRFKLSASDNHLVPTRFILALCCCAVVVKPTYIYFLILLRCNRCAWWIVGHQTIQMYTTIVCTICLIAGLILYPFFSFHLLLLLINSLNDRTRGKQGLANHRVDLSFASGCIET